MVQVMDKPARKETEPHAGEVRAVRSAGEAAGVDLPVREAGIARFAELGFPTLQQEDWRFTNVAPIAKLPFKPVFQFARPGLTPEAVAGFTFGRLAASRLVFVNGHYAAELVLARAAAPGRHRQQPGGGAGRRFAG